MRRGKIVMSLFEDARIKNQETRWWSEMIGDLALDFGSSR